MGESICILVQAAEDGRRIALMDEGKLAEYYVEDAAEGSLVNGVFLGRVERVLPGMSAAFVQIGQAQNAFLPLKEQESFQRQTEEKALVSGAEVIVQVRKDAHDQKGAFISRDISLPGQALILMPRNRYIGVSKRVTDPTERETLLALGKELAGDAFGLILRQAALYTRRDAIEEELHDLLAQWEKIEQKAVHAKAPATLYREVSALAALVRDYAPRYQLGITCNDAVNRMPAPPTGLMWEQVSDTEMEALWMADRIDAQLKEALGRRVELKNGGSLVIDEREALTTVDVNSGRFVGSKEEDVALRQNLNACPEIARQLRLRNCSGIILIDFIDMQTDAQRTAVLERLRDELSRERDKTVLHGFTSLGLLEMTRKRTRPSLRDALQTPCTACGGTGYQSERERQRE